MNRFTWLLAVACLLTVGVSQQGSDLGLGRVKNDSAPGYMRPIAQIPAPRSTEVVIIFDNGDYTVLTIGQYFSIPKSESFRATWGVDATYKFVSTGEKSGNANYEIVAR